VENNQIAGTCCPNPGCEGCNCTECEYTTVCEGDPQKIDYCPRPHSCPNCGANCLECKLWLSPLVFYRFSDMTESEALRSMGVEVTERDGKKGILLPARDGKEPIFIPASDDKPDVIVSSTISTDRVKDSIQVACSQCGTMVWLSPSSQDMLDRYPDTPVICIDCFGKQAKGEEDA
jgi:hypothetical protein